MTATPFWPADLAMKWDAAADPSAPDQTDYNYLHKVLTFLERELYVQYIPTVGPEHDDFETRFANWLANLDNEPDKQLLFQLAPRITFLGRVEFSQMHRAAFTGPITRWVMDELKLDFTTPNLDTLLNSELRRHTWYCPLTDSMPISEFHHANDLGGVDHRPDWRSLSAFGDPARILDYMTSHRDTQGSAPLKRLVILEDFVGSGTQMRRSVAGQPSPALDFAATSLPAIPILFVPMVICPEGASQARSLASTHANLTFESILQLRETDTIAGSKDQLFVRVRDLVDRTYPQVEGDMAAQPRPYAPLGFAETGATVVLYHNTPANTLPIIQHESSSWRALFPRSARIR